MKKCLFTLLSFLIFSSAIAQFQLNGKVVQHDNNAPLANCILYLNQSTTPYFTTEDGSFVIPNLSPGDHALRVVKEGFDDLTRAFKLDKNEYLLLELFPKGTGPEDKAIYKSLFTDEVIVKATRANNNTPTTNTTVTAEDLQEENLGQDLPYLLESEQSVVVFSDAGNGVGYTSMRIRGTDMSRINFTINGIPYIDPES